LALPWALPPYGKAEFEAERDDRALFSNSQW